MSSIKNNMNKVSTNKTESDSDSDNDKLTSTSDSDKLTSTSDSLLKEFNLNILIHFIEKLDGVLVETINDETIISFYVREIHNNKNVSLCQKNYHNYRKIFKFQKQKQLPKKIVSSLLVSCSKRLHADIRKSTKHFRVSNNGTSFDSTSGHYKIMIN